jgi:hypothetical protein
VGGGGGGGTTANTSGCARRKVYATADHSAASDSSARKWRIHGLASISIVVTSINTLAVTNMNIDTWMDRERRLGFRCGASTRQPRV